MATFQLLKSAIDPGGALMRKLPCDEGFSIAIPKLYFLSQSLTSYSLAPHLSTLFLHTFASLKVSDEMVIVLVPNGLSK